MTRRLILDCDPGHDDAIAILLAAGDPGVEIAAITTVSGNQSIEKVTRNALQIAELAGLDARIPIAQGAHRPLLREAEHAPEYHGESGLDGPRLPEPTRALDPRHAVQLIIDTVMASEPGEITLVPTGALTNIALAVRLEPRIVERVREVVFMGGGVHVGNHGPFSEFNVAIDPEAAAIVIDAGWPVTMIGLDATHQAVVTPEIRSRLDAVGTRSAAFVGELLDFYGAAYAVYGFEHPPVHDPVTVAQVIDPTLVRTVRAPLAVELTGTHTLGMTVADLRAEAPEACCTWVALGVENDRFWTLVESALARLP
ncbi:nucleoside hydrolase [Schumannella sp. 10F1B-5-1]|uniref:nucleoside hydrolase n=1 Tax=Schumannella sp. 10F1B-5-1 TaxID=2590780 RepID=UPI0011327836|nr:nucleoside hydrolase [Schumannella sp. 10F1B-5-1]TPW73527.1 nucleoside hydrolase [Schumannella sp. 10F1B-5-1]